MVRGIGTVEGDARDVRTGGLMEELGMQGSLDGGMISGSCGWVLW